MKWLKDKTYFLRKCNKLKIQLEDEKKTYAKSIQKLSEEILDKEFQIAHLEERNRARLRQIRQLREELKKVKEG